MRSSFSLLVYLWDVGPSIMTENPESGVLYSIVRQQKFLMSRHLNFFHCFLLLPLWHHPQRGLATKASDRLSILRQQRKLWSKVGPSHNSHKNIKTLKKASQQTKKSMTYDSLPPFHSLPFPAYYRTECQDKYSTSRLAHHVVYSIDNECASSIQLTPCLDFDDDDHTSDDHGRNSDLSSRFPKPSYDCKPFVHGHQYSRKIKCFGPWGDAAGFACATISEISRTIAANSKQSTASLNKRNNSSNKNLTAKSWCWMYRMKSSRWITWL